MTGDCTMCGRPPESHPVQDQAGSHANLQDHPKPLRAARTMRARRTKGTCPLCGLVLNAGRQIGLVRGTGWCHAACIVIRNRKIKDSSEDETTAG